MNGGKEAVTSPSGGLSIAPSLAPALDTVRLPFEAPPNRPRLLSLCALSMALAFVTGLAANALMTLIALFTNLAFYGRLGVAPASPAGNQLGIAVVLVPVVGGLVVGLMARYGSQAIRGHGIPEAMEKILVDDSRIPARLIWLKPLSAAVSIGTGGPFGAEGPIIATGGALGSFLGQRFRTTGVERKTLLAAGAAAGMAATFGSPVSAVLLAIELLLFEFRARSIIPVALAAASATGVRFALVGSHPVFPMPALAQPESSALVAYIVVGALVGLLSTLVTRAVYAVEDLFEKLPVHWMWWPAIGGVGVGIAGFVVPRTMGVGYDNIEQIVSGSLPLRAIGMLCAFKLISWLVSLGSGTSGGTLAPLFTIGGGAGTLIGAAALAIDPSLPIDLRICGLVGMASMFAGASRALLASVVFAFETTLQPMGLLPLLAGCTAAHLSSVLLMRHSIMTEKLARRGVRVPSDYEADLLAHRSVSAHCTRRVVTLSVDEPVREVRERIVSHASGYSHQGYPVVDRNGYLAGVVTRRDLLESSAAGNATLGEVISRSPAVIFGDSSLREAADHMVREGVGRLPVVDRSEPRLIVGIISRSDLLHAHRGRLAESINHAHATA